MIKKGLAMLLTFAVLCFVLQNIHILILEKHAIALPFSLKKNYLFNTGFSILVCLNIFLLSTVNKFKEQLGLVYLIALFIKIILFFAIFYKSIVKVDEMEMASKISMLLPLLIFLLTEVIFIAKQINQKS